MREALIYVGIIFHLAAVLFLIKIFVQLVQTRLDWKDASISNENFYKKYDPLLRDVVVGCSFSPEELDEAVAYDALKFIIEEMGIRDIRLGLRWNRISPEPNTISLSYYLPFLRLCFEHNVRLCLNVGPVKTIRWPESHVPEHIFQLMGGKPTPGSEFIANSLIGFSARHYLETLLELLKHTFNEEELKCITMIQPENEPFNNMGEYNWTVSDQYLEQMIQIVHKHFPDARILVNSAGRFDLSRITQLFMRMRKKKSIRKNFVVGYDYYYKTENRDKFFLSRMLDSIYFSKPFDMTVRTLRSVAERYDFGVEVTEAQFETWGKSFGPGSTLKDFKFMILRTARLILPNHGKTKLVRLWGVEKFALAGITGTLSDEQKELCIVIKKINSFSGNIAFDTFVQTRRH